MPCSPSTSTPSRKVRACARSPCTRAPSEPAPADGTRTGVRDYAVDPAQAARLWTLSAELTGVDAFA
jgi:hypothetical protein